MRVQAALRRYRIGEITAELLMASRMLRAGNIFMKYSRNGPPHDRWVWVSPPVWYERSVGIDDMRTVGETQRRQWAIQWADPEKRKKNILKGDDATLLLEEIVHISEGLNKSELGHSHPPRSPEKP